MRVIIVESAGRVHTMEVPGANSPHSSFLHLPGGVELRGHKCHLFKRGVPLKETGDSNKPVDLWSFWVYIARRELLEQERAEIEALAVELYEAQACAAEVTS